MGLYRIWFAEGMLMGALPITDKNTSPTAAATAKSELVITYLQMNSEAAFRPAYVELEGMHIVRMGKPDVAFYRFLYGSVGESWRWRDRLIMPDAELSAILHSPTNEVHLMQIGNVPAGYFELEVHGTDCKLAYLGLRREYMGLGLGKHLLSSAIARAWTHPILQLTVQTCNLDAPAALQNYIKRGFSIVRVESQPMPTRYQ